MLPGSIHPLAPHVPLPHAQPQILDFLDAALTPSERDAIMELLDERITSRRPVAYLVKSTWYVHRALRVLCRIWSASPWLDLFHDVVTLGLVPSSSLSTSERSSRGHSSWKRC